VCAHSFVSHRLATAMRCFLTFNLGRTGVCVDSADGSWIVQEGAAPESAPRLAWRLEYEKSIAYPDPNPNPNPNPNPEPNPDPEQV